ncbi:plasmid mobilization protein MobA [Pseudomonas asuensis]
MIVKPDAGQDDSRLYAATKMKKTQFVKARDCGMSIGQFLLKAALGRQTRSKMDAHILNELRRLGGLQKHLFNEGKGVFSKEYSAILIEIRQTIARIGE